VPLVTVELAFDGPFELEAGDADILIQIRGGDVMWQKERLLNLAIARLPVACDKVAWLDCDVVFESRDWAERLESALEHNAVVQPFSTACALARGVTSFEARPQHVQRTFRSIVHGIAAGEAAVELFLGHRLMSYSGFHCGMAWAARREVIAQRGLYDAGIIGGGDRMMVDVMFGYSDEIPRRFNMIQGEADHFMRWAKPYYESVRDSITHLDGTIYHLWHGDVGNRKYVKRQLVFREFGFDPNGDIAVAESGAWQWSSDKRGMHAYARRYFASRREDG